jgi:hypothetical protein
MALRSLRQIRRARNRGRAASPSSCLARLGLVVLLVAGGATLALGQGRPGADGRPPVGGVTSLPDAVMVYLARGTPGACGENCAEWIAIEGTVHWDGLKRAIAGLDRFGERKRPIFLDLRGPSHLGVATSIGRILRERGHDVGVGRTIVEQCRGLGENECAALKRAGGATNASLSPPRTCDIACILMLAGGVRRTVPEGTTVVIHGTHLVHRLGLNISDERREGMHARMDQQYRIYLTQMGVDPALADMIDANYGTAHVTELSRADMVRLRIVTPR